MNYANPRSAMNHYAQTAVNVGVMGASPHRLIQMLLEGALDKVAAAKGCLARGAIEEKGRQISWAISIIGGLRASLDTSAGGDIAQNLDDLYEYMERRLFEAHKDNDSTRLDEVTSLLREIKTAWDAIPVEVQQAHGQMSGAALAAR